MYPPYNNHTWPFTYRPADKYSMARGQPPQLPSGPRGVVFRQVLPGAEGLLRVLREVAASRGKTASQVAINWCMCKKTVPIPGAKSLPQLRDNLGALGWRLTDAEVARLDAAAGAVPRGMVQNVFQTK